MVSKGFYEHYKGGIYEVIGMSTHTETNERLVVYKDMSGNLWSRPESMWNQEIHIENTLWTKPRFEPVMAKVIKTDFGYIKYEKGITYFTDIDNASQWHLDANVDNIAEKFGIVNPKTELVHSRK